MIKAINLKRVTMIINSANTYQNFAPSHLNLANLEQKETEAKTEQKQELEQSFHTNYKQTYSSEFGFRIDEKGFFEKDLNQIANLPQNYAIHINSVRLIAKEIVKTEQINHNQIDLPKLLNEHYNALKSLNEEFKSEDDMSLNRSQISSLKAGFSTMSGEFNDAIIRVYPHQEALIRAQKEISSLNTLFLDNKITSFQFDKALSNTSSNKILKPYLSKNGEVSKIGLLMNFTYHNIKETNEKEANFFMKPANLDLNSHQNLYKILKGELKTEDFIKDNNEEKMSFDLYLYVNGVDKKTTSQDKLSVFFQQYINYQKEMNLREFANSSSIFKLYSDGVREDFEAMARDFKSQNENLENINLQRAKEAENFLERRQKIANFNKIVSSYLDVMNF